MTWDGNDNIRRFIKKLQNEIECYEENIADAGAAIVSQKHKIECCENYIKDYEHVRDQLKALLERNGFPYEENL